MDAETIARVWTVSLIIFTIVLVVVAVLLTLILHEARRVLGGVKAIWVTGQKIANNTIHIPLLVKTNDVAGKILASAAGIAAATAAVHKHAEECPGCPSCVIGPEWSR